MSKHIEFKRISNDKEPLLEHVIFKPNGKHVGEIFLDVDGECYFTPMPNSYGAWAGYVLMEIAIHLSMLNCRSNN